MKKLLSLVLLMGALFIAAPPEAKAHVVDKVSKTEIYQEINAYRAEHGLPALEISNALERSAEVYAFKLDKFYGGELRHDQAWLNRKRKLSSELLAYSDHPVTAWKKSYRHNNLLLSKRFTAMGIGVNKGGGYVLRVMDR